ncbi:MAG TPA: hypothetical protein ENN09_06055 [Planctomycetes bacterium]|nr:hypothetical protein [Planctomycetota bacterium]
MKMRQNLPLARISAAIIAACGFVEVLDAYHRPPTEAEKTIYAYSKPPVTITSPAAGSFRFLNTLPASPPAHMFSSSTVLLLPCSTSHFAKGEMAGRGDTPVSVASKAGRQLIDPFRQKRLVIPYYRPMTLSGSCLAYHPACPALRYAQSGSHVLNHLSTLRRAQKFPEAASRRMALSKDRSATSFFSLEFSCSIWTCPTVPDRQKDGVFFFKR